jgi:hypothetical protein
MKHTAVEFLEQELNMVKSSSTKMYGQIIFLEKDVIQLLNQAKGIERMQKAEEYLKGFKDGKEYQIKLDELTFKSE